MFMLSERSILQDLTFGAGSLDLIGSFFFEGIITGKSYLEMFDTLILPCFRALFGDDSLLIKQDGAPPNNHTYVSAYLDNVALDHWIGQRGQIEYPAYSPDLTRSDFYLWGYLKNVVHSKTPHTLKELRYDIGTASQGIPVATLRDVTNNVRHPA
ncbi:DUF4817 domain-containing protein [Trichonephila clavipes]|nr:DUF4817 domain-containing protein [Trichonephila clavipes]